VNGMGFVAFKYYPEGGAGCHLRGF